MIVIVVMVMRMIMRGSFGLLFRRVCSSRCLGFFSHFGGIQILAFQWVARRGAVKLLRAEIVTADQTAPLNPLYESYLRGVKRPEFQFNAPHLQQPV